MMKRCLNRCVTTRPSAKKRKSHLLVVVQLTFVSLLFTFFSLVITTAHVGAACSCQDQLALLSEFYNATDGPVSWTNKWDLTSSSAPCGFYGATCDDAAGAITSIVLVSNNLRGSLPKSLSLLGSLFQVFVVNNNAISGTLPDSYHNWTNMMNFGVYGNLFTGPLPSSYSFWQAITSFNVGTTNISGTLPLAYGTSTGWCTSLKIFIIENCAGINGTLPPEYGNWSNLGVMNAEGTGLSGSIPAEYAQWRHIDTISFTNVLGVGNLSGTISAKLSSGWVSLTQLSLRGNKFTGSLPHGVAPGEVIWPKMRNFVLAQNQFGGTLPVMYSNWTLLSTFSISVNSITGTIPSNYSLMGRSATTGIRLFQVDENQLSGTLPASLGDAVHMNIFDVSYNQLDGTLPASYGNWSLNLTSMYVNNNRFSGTLPSSWGSWGSTVLNFYCTDNQLSGTLPPQFSAWTSISKFQISSNNFTGTLPYQYSSWGSHILQLLIDNNNFTGSIPPNWATEFTSLTTLFASHNQLSGSIPSFFQNAATTFLGFGFNQFNGTLSTIPATSTLLFLEVQNNTGLDGVFPTMPQQLGIVCSCGTSMCSSVTSTVLKMYVCVPDDVSLSEVVANTARSEALLTSFSKYMYAPACPIATTTTVAVPTTTAPVSGAPQAKSNISTASTSATVTASTATLSYVSIVASGATAVGVSARGAIPNLQRVVTALALNARCEQRTASASTNATGSSGDAAVDPPYNTAIDNPLVLEVPVPTESLVYAAGAAVGNTALVVGVALVSHLLGVVVIPFFERRLGSPTRSAGTTKEAPSTCRVLVTAVVGLLPAAPLPGSLMLLFTMLLQPSIASSVTLWYSSGRSAATIVIGCVVVLLWIAAVAWFVFAVLVRGRRASLSARKKAPKAARFFAALDPVARVERRSRSSASDWLRRLLGVLFSPTEEWTAFRTRDDARRHRRSHVYWLPESLMVLIEPYVGARAWYFAVEWAVAAVSAVVVGVANAITTDADSSVAAVCAAAEWGGWVALALTAVDVLLCAALRPLSVRWDFASTMVTGSLSIVAAALVIGGLSTEADDVATAASIVQLAMMLLMTLIEVGRSRIRRNGTTFPLHGNTHKTPALSVATSLVITDPSRPHMRAPLSTVATTGPIALGVELLNFQLQHLKSSEERLEILLTLACRRRDEKNKK